jgi:hypothetical protein
VLESAAIASDGVDTTAANSNAAAILAINLIIYCTPKGFKTPFLSSNIY